ncbi:MAG TPA: hypothetical protein VN493_02210 [Thermoanaerobaculia bacterium]|nr:hypothetical protein [Thermoanaerobaculia bacterium]
MKTKAWYAAREVDKADAARNASPRARKKSAYAVATDRMMSPGEWLNGMTGHRNQATITNGAAIAASQLRKPWTLVVILPYNEQDEALLHQLPRAPISLDKAVKS